MIETNFSFHAFRRMRGRISMTHGDLAKLLDADLAINIGEEINSNRSHKLFYSKTDKMCFVAIQDVKTGTVVTVLPIDYHENISWKVSIESQSRARNLVINDENVSLQDSEVLYTNVSVFRVSAIVVDEYGQYVKSISLGSWPCRPYEYSLDDLIEDEDFVSTLIKRIADKLISKESLTHSIQMIAIRLGKKGHPVCFDVEHISMLDIIGKNS